MAKQPASTTTNAGLTTFSMMTGVINPMENRQERQLEATSTDAVSRLSDLPFKNEWLEEDAQVRREDSVKLTLHAYIRGKFFDKCKFISVQKIKRWSDNDNALCLKICKDLNVYPAKYRAFWEEHAVLINATLNQRRNDVTTLLKKEFKSKSSIGITGYTLFNKCTNIFVVFVFWLEEQILIYDKDNEGLPPMHEILQLSMDKDVYIWFLSVFLKHGVGARNWNQLHLRKTISKYCTPSTEAIVLLIIENNYNRWIDEHNNVEKLRKELAPPLYTNGGISKRGGKATSKQGGGWSTEGIRRFNELIVMVNSDRKSRLEFEEMVKEKLTADNTVKRWTAEKDGIEEDEDEEEIVAIHDFDDVEGFSGTEIMTHMEDDNDDNEIEQIAAV